MELATTENWWKFIITDEQALEIQAKNIEAINKFFADNEKLLRNIVRRYFSQAILYKITRYNYVRLLDAQRYYELDDMLHQIYVDLLDYKFKDSKELYYCITRSCVYMITGGYKSYCAYRRCISLDKPIGKEDGDGVIADLIASNRSIEDELEITPTMLRAFEMTLDKVAKVVYPNSKRRRKAFIRRA